MPRNTNVLSQPAARLAMCAGGSMLALAVATAAVAQTITDASSPSARSAGVMEEVIVTARKRQETVMQTPVTLQVITAEKIRDLKVQSVNDIATVAPGLIINPAFASVGSVPFLRGIGSGPTGSFIDQSVGLAIDGVGQGHGTFYRAGTFDLARIEVLKGPQGLFFGKSTTAGMISLTTADPTPDWQSEFSAGYEFVADELNLSGFASGPVTDKVGIRVAGYYTDMKGFLYNPNPASNVNHRLENKNVGGRITLTYNDDERFRAKFKTTYFRGAGATGNNYQFYNCIRGVPQNPIGARFDTCNLDKWTGGYGVAQPYNPNVSWLASFGNRAAFATGNPIKLAGDGSQRDVTQTVNSVLQLDYDVSDALTLTSVSGYSWVNVTDFNGLNAFAPATEYSVAGRRNQTEWSQELRLASDFQDSWFNFMVGGLYTSTNVKTLNDASIAIATLWNSTEVKQTGEVKSAFGELTFTPIPKLELNAGVRYTEVEKDLPSLIMTGNTVPAGQNGVNVASRIPNSRTSVKETNTSPELTAAYRPSSDLTIFGSYKWGYKGPGYNVAGFLNNSFLTSQPLPFGGEKVRGGEAGVKAQALNRRLSMSLVGYTYKYIGLQVSNFDFDTQTITVSNGADARVSGVEAEVFYYPPAVPGLQLSASANYNDAKYTRFPGSPCFAGQSVQEGCVPNAAGVPVQNLKGKRLYEAPKWTGYVGATYEGSLTEDYLLRLSGRVNYTSGYYPLSNLLPESYQQNYATVDASVRVGPKSKKWDVGLVGKNLTNRYYVVVGYDSGVLNPGVHGDPAARVSRGRQVMLEFTARPF